jgi:hypothetical protein
MVMGPGKKLVKGKKAVDVEIVSVDEKKQLANLKSLEDNKTVFKSVAWTDLESA